jgi:hypothetical protein
MRSEPLPAHPCAGTSAPVSTRAVSSSIDESGRVDVSVFRLEDWVLENEGYPIVQSSPSVGRRMSRKPGNMMDFEFFAGPIDMAWLGAAALLPGAALHVALAIQHQVNLRKTEWVPISNQEVKKFGVERDAKTRAITQLSMAGLIEVHTHPGRSPRVKVIGDRCRGRFTSQ